MEVSRPRASEEAHSSLNGVFCISDRCKPEVTGSAPVLDFRPESPYQYVNKHQYYSIRTCNKLQYIHRDVCSFFSGYLTQEVSYQLPEIKEEVN